MSDFYSHRVLAFAQSGRVETVCKVDAQPSGLGFNPDGELLVVSMLDRRLMTWQGGKLREVADLSRIVDYPLNDMVVDRAGGAYIGNFGFQPSSGKIGTTDLVRVERDGTAHKVASGLCFPNGMVIDSIGQRLLVAETYAFRIAGFDVAEDGSLSNRTVWAAFSDGESVSSVGDALGRRSVLPDGLALDEEGLVWVADANGRGAIRIDSGGKIADRIELDAELTAFAVTLGGKDRRTLFICASVPLSSRRGPGPYGSMLLACEVEVPGAGLP